MGSHVRPRSLPPTWQLSRRDQIRFFRNAKRPDSDGRKMDRRRRDPVAGGGLEVSEARRLPLHENHVQHEVERLHGPAEFVALEPDVRADRIVYVFEVATSRGHSLVRAWRGTDERVSIVVDGTPQRS